MRQFQVNFWYFIMERANCLIFISVYSLFQNHCSPPRPSMAPGGMCGSSHLLGPSSGSSGYHPICFCLSDACFTFIPSDRWDNIFKSVRILDSKKLIGETRNYTFSLQKTIKKENEGNHDIQVYFISSIRFSFIIIVWKKYLQFGTQCIWPMMQKNYLLKWFSKKAQIPTGLGCNTYINTSDIRLQGNLIFEVCISQIPCAI